LSFYLSVAAAAVVLVVAGLRQAVAVLAAS